MSFTVKMEGRKVVTQGSFFGYRMLFVSTDILLVHQMLKKIIVTELAAPVPG